MTVECPTCGKVLEVDTKAWHPNGPSAMEAADQAMDAHERAVHW